MKRVVLVLAVYVLITSVALFYFKSNAIGSHRGTVIYEVLWDKQLDRLYLEHTARGNVHEHLLLGLYVVNYDQRPIYLSNYSKLLGAVSLWEVGHETLIDTNYSDYENASSLQAIPSIGRDSLEQLLRERVGAANDFPRQTQDDILTENFQSTEIFVWPLISAIVWIGFSLLLAYYIVRHIFLRVRRNILVEQRMLESKCIHCGYCMKKNQGRCPECGE